MFNRQGVVLLGNVAHWPGDIYRPTVCVYLNMNITQADGWKKKRAAATASAAAPSGLIDGHMYTEHT